MMLEEVLAARKKLFIMDYSPTLADFVIAGYYYTFAEVEESVRRKNMLTLEKFPLTEQYLTRTLRRGL